MLHIFCVSMSLAVVYIWEMKHWFCKDFLMFTQSFTLNVDFGN